MATNVIMPQLGESVVEGTVSKWLKHEGERVKEYDPIMEVNTDKVDSEIPSPASGVVLKVYVPEGTTVKAGTLLAVIGEPGEKVPDGANGAGHAAPGAAAHALAAAPAPSPQAAPVSAAAPAPAPAAAPTGRAARRELGFISPVVARLAEEHNVDLHQVPGTGNGGRITKKDVLAYLEQSQSGPGSAPAAEAAGAVELPPWEQPGEGDLFRPTELQFGGSPAAAPAAAPAPQAPAAVQPPAAAGQAAGSAAAPGAGDTAIPVEGMRKLIAEHMVRSERTAPHVTSVFEIDMSRVLAHLEAHKAQFAGDGARLTLTAYLVQACVAALKAVPMVNSQWAEDKIILKRSVNIGVAVALDDGLIVPVVKRADEKSLLGIAREVNDLAQRARTRGLKPDEVQGGTFTITNHGVSGSLLAAPIINQPQSAILGVGAVQKRAVVINDAIAIRPMVYITLTIDHRVLDGATGDRFMQVVKSTLEGWP